MSRCGTGVKPLYGKHFVYGQLEYIGWSFEEAILLVLCRPSGFMHAALMTSMTWNGTDIQAVLFTTFTGDQERSSLRSLGRLSDKSPCSEKGGGSRLFIRAPGFVFAAAESFRQSQSFPR